MMKTAPVEIRRAPAGCAERVLTDGDRPLLALRARWPRLEETAPGLRRINRYYDALADRWVRRWEGPLLARARETLEPGAPPWRASLDFRITLLENGRLSLWLDTEEDIGERRPRRVRQGDTWEVPAGFPLSLRELLPRRRWWRGEAVAQVRRQIGERLQEGESAFYPDWLTLASRRFSPRRFYLTPEGVWVFYPPETIAPALEGFPAFCLGPLPGGDKN